MPLKNKKGVTLVEVLISISLLSALLVGLVGAFFISKNGTQTARHKMVAMGHIRNYIAQEVKAGFLGGYVAGNYYVTVSSNTPVSVVIDDRGTTGTSDDLNGTITPSPYPATVVTLGTSPKTSQYKTIGFIVQWSEGSPARTYRERAMAYVADHK